MNKLILFLLVTNLIFVSNILGQQSDYFTEDNLNARFYSSLKINECREYSTELKLGLLRVNTLESIYYYDTMGNIIKEKCYLDKKTVLFEITYSYNSLKQLQSEEWQWSPTSKHDKTIYKFDSLGRLESFCDSQKFLGEKVFSYDTCKILVYKGNILSAVLSDKNDTLEHFILFNDTLKKFSNNLLVSEFYNGNIVTSYMGDKVYHYSYNLNRQIIKTTITTMEKGLFETVDFFYKNNLLTKVISKDNKGQIKYVDKYYYKKRRNSS